MSTFLRGSRQLLQLAISLLVSISAAQAQVAPYPGRPVRIVVGFPPGNTTDTVARILADELGKAYKQTFIVDNKPGATGTLGVDAVLKAPADGYTLVMASSGSIAIAPSLYKKLPYDVRRDFVPITIAGYSPTVLVVPANANARSLPEFVRYAASHPTTYGSAGNGSTQHLTAEMFRTAAHIGGTHVPYKGSGPVLTDVIGGTLDWAFESLASALPLIKANKLRPLAVSTSSRLPVLPDVPTIAESGYPAFSASAWLVLGAPKGVPDEVVKSINAAVAKASALPAVQEAYAQIGLVPPYSSTQAAAASFIEAETKKWAEIVTRSGATID